MAAENLYGIWAVYIFWLMHHNGSPRQRAKLKRMEEFVNYCPRLWGMSALRGKPECERVYLALCKRYGIQPEAC
jgi:hypothetical protein